jgi:transposase InsO family protein
VLRPARDNPRWGYLRIVGEMKGLGFAPSASTVRMWHRQAGLGPVGTRGGTTWREFVRTHRRSMLAVDFFSVETVWLQRLYVLFFIELGSRRVHFAGCTANPTAPWVTQQARQLTWTLAERAEPIRFLIRDRDQKFTSSFDEVFRGAGIEIIRTPFRVPQANGVAERFVRTIRSECLDWLLILDHGQLERAATVFVDHYKSRAVGGRGARPEPYAAGMVRLFRLRFGGEGSARGEAARISRGPSLSPPPAQGRRAWLTAVSHPSGIWDAGRSVSGTLSPPRAVGRAHALT